jgi:hypothetical protein
MKYFLIAAIVLLQGCTSTMAVRTLESTIRDAALVAKSATRGASDKLKIEVSVTNGFTAGGTLPIPVVPLDISKTSSTSTKLTLEVDLIKFNPVDDKSVHDESEIFILDTKTGLLSTPTP